MKVLIVEDEKNLLELMTRYMKREGYVCEVAHDFQEGFKKINNFEYDCAVIDLNLPGGNGLRLVEMLREDNTKGGIIIISARDKVEDRITGLNMGADDYLTKPFNLSELNARIKAVLRRKSNQINNMLKFGQLQIDLDERKVSANNKELKLTKKEYNILLYLARNKNRVVTKDSIAEYIWGDYMDDAISYDFIFAHVKNLRKKLKENDCGELLKTVYGIGYKFSAP